MKKFMLTIVQKTVWDIPVFAENKKEATKIAETIQTASKSREGRMLELKVEILEEREEE